MMKYKVLKGMVFVLLCTACTPKQVITPHNGPSKQPAEWLVVKSDMGKVDDESSFAFMDKEGETVKDINVRNGRNILLNYYDVDNNIYYQYGAGGIYSVNIPTMEVEKLSDKSIQGLRINEDVLYYHEYISGGENNYRINICKLANNDCLELDYDVNDFIVHDNKTYIVSALDSTKNEHAVRIYEDKKLMKEIPMKEAGSLYIYQGTVYYLMMDDMVNLDTKQRLSYVDNQGNPITLSNTYHAFYPAKSNTYLIDHSEDGVKLYKAQFKDDKIYLKEILLYFDNIIDTQFDKRNTFTFMDKDRQFYSFDIHSGKTTKLIVPIDDLNSSILHINKQQ